MIILRCIRAPMARDPIKIPFNAPSLLSFRTLHVDFLGIPTFVR